MYRRPIIPYFDKALIPVPKAKRLPKRNGSTYVVEIFKRGIKKGEKDDTAIVGKKDCNGGIMKTYGKKIKIEYKSRLKNVRSASPDMEYLAKVYRIYRNRESSKRTSGMQTEQTLCPHRRNDGV